MRHCPTPNDEPHHRNDHLFRGQRDQVIRADHSLMSIRAFRAAVFVVLLAACGLVSGVQAADTVADGDTRAVNQNRPLALEGPWAFHWRHWVAPGQAEGERPPPDARVSLPGSWTAVMPEADSPLPPRGYASYRKVVSLGEEVPERLLLRIPRVYSAYRLYTDGDLVAEVGRIGRTPAAYRPDYGERSVVLTDVGPELELIFHVSNYSSRVAGFAFPLKLGTPEAVQRALVGDVIRNAVLTGGLLLVGLYQVMLFFFRRDRAYLYFGLVVGAWGVHTLFAGELLSHLGWHWPVALARFMDAFSALGTAMAYLLFLAALFPRQMPRRPLYGLAAVLLGYALLTPLLGDYPWSVFTGWLAYLFAASVAVAVLAVIRAWWQGEPDAGLILIGTGVLGATALFQAVFINVDGVRQASTDIGILVALAMHTLTLARRYGRAYERLRVLESEQRRANRLKDEFLANTSHELRTPLHGMVAMAESLPRDDPRLARGLDLIIRSGHRLARLVDDVLALTRLRHDDLPIDPRPCRLEGVVSTVLETCRPLVGDRPLQMKSTLPEDLPPIKADPDRLHQVLFNLVGNAIKYSEQGTIEVRAGCDGGPVHVEVVDQGPGMAGEDIQRLLEPYEQAARGEQAGGGGVGLGLAISRRIVEQHGGTFRVESTPGAGTRVAFTVPRAENAPEGPHSGPPAASPVPVTAQPRPRGPQTGFVPHRILVVDDDPDAALVLAEQVAQAGYPVQTVHSGAEALAAVSAGPPDLILLDVMMPDMNGIEVCRRIREDHDPAALPILLITALTRPDDTVVGLEAGANDYLPKPHYRQELLARVEAQLRVRENEQMRWALKEARQGRQEAEDSRGVVVALLNTAVRCWELETGATRADLAERSGLWTVTLDGSTRKTRTLDRYLSLETLPKRPRWGVVSRTAKFVMQHLECPERRRELEAGIQELADRVR